MDAFFSIILIISGFALLLGAGHFLVDSSVNLAEKLKVSSAVIGLTFVAIGTSMPELVVSLVAVFGGSSEIAVANVIGSNSVNIAVVLGVTAMILPIEVKGTVVKIEWPAVFFVSVLFLLFALDGRFSPIEGAVFLTLLIMFYSFMIRVSRASKGIAKELREGTKVNPNEIKEERGFGFIFAVMAGSLVLLFLGGKLVLVGAVDLARIFGMSERVIGLTIVALGTSLPELITSLIAIYRKLDEIALGNILGSNLVNILLIIGSTSLMGSIPVSHELVSVDGGYMLVVLAVIFPFMIFMKKIPRFLGAILFISWIAYTVLIVREGLGA